LLALSLSTRVASRLVSSPPSLRATKKNAEPRRIVTPHRVLSRLVVMADGDDAPKGMFARLGFVRIPHRSSSRARHRRDAS